LGLRNRWQSAPSCVRSVCRRHLVDTAARSLVRGVTCTSSHGVEIPHTNTHFRVSQDYPGICELSYRTYRLRCRGARPLSASVRPSDPIPSLIQQHATIDRTTSRRCIVPSFDVVLQSVFYTLPSEFPPCPVCCSISRHSQEVGPSRSHARSCPHSEEMRQGGGVGDSQITVEVENMGKSIHRATITAAIIRTMVEC